MYVMCGGGAGLLSLATELFLSEELGPVTVIRAPPSPGYDEDWVKFNLFFSNINLQLHKTTSRALPFLFFSLECPLSPMPLGDTDIESVLHASPFLCQ